MSSDNEKVGLWVWVRRLSLILVVVGSLAVTGTSAIKYFARQVDLDRTDARQELSDKRLGLSISQDNLDREDADVRWMKQQTAFQRKTVPISPAEREMIEAAEKKLAEHKAQHTERIKQFEEDYKENF